MTSATLAQLFQDAVSRRPDGIALRGDHGQTSYRELSAQVESLRPLLADTAGTRIGVLAHRTPLAYAAIQAILCEGRSYVPLNPGFPAQRNAWIAAKAGLATLVAGEECAQALAALAPSLPPSTILVVDGSCPALEAIAAAHGWTLRAAPAIRPAHDARPCLPPPADGSAYVLFTSGSTGQPKGVRVTQANVLRYVRSFLELHPIAPEDRLSQTFDLTFDLSVHDQFVAWAAGATLVVYPDRALTAPLEFTREHGVTVWFSVPSLPAFLDSSRQASPGALPEVRLSLFCGEKLTWKTSRLWREIAPASVQANLYGPTEATIAITHFTIAADFPDAACHQGGIPIGRPFPGQLCSVRDESGAEVPDGQSGELWLGGDQVTPGYLEDPDKTAERFVASGGIRWYRTGDLVHRQEDGVLQYEGRVDFQVKVMGYRIELGEIEHALLRASEATFSLADVAAFQEGMDEIFALLPASCASRKKEIRSFLKDTLPPYMVPRKLFFFDDVPLNANGKMDRGAIRARVLALKGAG